MSLQLKNIISNIQSGELMFCNKCGTENSGDAKICSECRNTLKNNTTFGQLHIISEEIEKLDFIYKLGFYLMGFGILLSISIYTLLIAPLLIYLLGGKGWPENSLIKAPLYYFVYVVPVALIIYALVIIAAVVGAFVFGMGPP